MSVNNIIYISLCLLVSANRISGTLESTDGRIKITVGTSAGCGDTVAFVRDQLAETYELYKDHLTVEFVPWGRSERHEDGTITCQFGVNDCWANRLHRCALDLLNGNQDAQVSYMVCEFTGRRAFLQGSYQCAQEVGLSLVDVDYCMSTTGDPLDLVAEEASAGPMAVTAINFVPYIVFNEEINVELHQSARLRLRSMVCFALAEDPSVDFNICQI